MGYNNKTIKGDNIEIVRRTASGRKRKGEPVIRIPWYYDSDAYNMCVPDTAINITKYEDMEWVDLIEDIDEVDSLFIMTELPNYDFIRKMKGLTQLYIYSAPNLEDISFIMDLPRLHYLFINDTSLKDLKPLLKYKRKNKHDSYSLRNVGIIKSKIEKIPPKLLEQSFSQFYVFESPTTVKKLWYN